MPKYQEIIKAREEEIAKVLQLLDGKTYKFNEPKLVLIGGYALRAFIPYSRATRDCDFIVQSRNNEWNIKLINNMLHKILETETIELKDSYGYLRMIKLLKEFKKIKISLDFMEKEIHGREKDDSITLDELFFDSCRKASFPIGNYSFEMFVPAYVDYLILKIISARPSDVRDVVALIRENGLPGTIKQRLKELVGNEKLVERKLTLITDEISHEKFVDSFRGTFPVSVLTENEKMKVLQQLTKLIKRTN